jgi:hypothetical protein
LIHQPVAISNRKLRKLSLLHVRIIGVKFPESFASWDGTGKTEKKTGMRKLDKNMHLIFTNKNVNTIEKM